MSEWIALSERPSPVDEYVWACSAGDKEPPSRPIKNPGQYDTYTHWQPLERPRGEIPHEPELTAAELVILLVDAMQERDFVQRLEFIKPDDLRIEGVAVVRQLRRLVKGPDAAEIHLTTGAALV